MLRGAKETCCCCRLLAAAVSSSCCCCYNCCCCCCLSFAVKINLRQNKHTHCAVCHAPPPRHLRLLNVCTAALFVCFLRRPRPHPHPYLPCSSSLSLTTAVGSRRMRLDGGCGGSSRRQRRRLTASLETMSTSAAVTFNVEIFFGSVCSLLSCRLRH